MAVSMESVVGFADHDVTGEVAFERAPIEQAAAAPAMTGDESSGRRPRSWRIERRSSTFVGEADSKSGRGVK